MWKEKLKKIMQEEALYGEQINSGATEKQLELFKNKVNSELKTNLHDEYCTMLLGDESFSLLGGLVGVHILKFLCGHKEYVFAYCIFQLGISQADFSLGIYYRLDYALYGIFEEFLGALVTSDYFFPVPLVNEDGVEVVGIVITADSVHIGVDAFACLIAVAIESHSLPLCQ